MSEHKQVVIYTDGACFSNPGPGGYGVVLLYNNHRRELSSGFRLTTNSRMEIIAAIAGLQVLKLRCHVRLYSDSEYVVKAMTQGWVYRWQSNGWWREKGERASNSDLWERMVQLCEHHTVEFVWLKGHTGHPENERCDKLARAASDQRDLPEDEGYYQAQAMAKSVKITEEGQPCRKCATPVEKRIPRQKRKPDQEYCYTYYLYCPTCYTMYLVEAAKQYLC